MRRTTSKGLLKQERCVVYRFALLLLACIGCNASDAMPTAEEAPPPSDLTPTQSPDLCADDPSCIASFPSTVSGTTRNGENAFDHYACAPKTPERGPETLIPVAIPEDGLLLVEVSTPPNERDVDVHILADRSADSCLNRGDKKAVAYVSKGLRFIAVDTYGGPSNGSDFSLSIQFVSPTTLETHGVNRPVASRALQAFANGWASGHTKRLRYTLIDFKIPSNQKRLWVLDLDTGELLYHLLVTHGSGSNPGPDPSRPTVFSNINDSHQSSLGLMKTGETYYGMWGYSLKLDGLEPGFNDLVRKRHIVIHGADWAGQDFIDSNGFLGQSWGCPTVDSKLSRKLIDTIKHETLVFSDYPDPKWLNGSEMFTH